MIYFDDSIDFGRLVVEKILFEFDKIPMIFVGQDTNKKRFLCLCTDCIEGDTWLVTKIERKVLLELIANKIPVLDAYKKANGYIYVINKEKNIYKQEKYLFANIPEDELPDADEKLDNPFLEDFVSVLEKEERQLHFSVQKSYSMELLWQEERTEKSKMFLIMVEPRQKKQTYDFLGGKSLGINLSKNSYGRIGKISVQDGDWIVSSKIGDNCIEKKSEMVLW